MNNLLTLAPETLGPFFRALNAKRILVITSCTGTKAAECDNPITTDDFALGADWIRERERKLGTVPAKDLYAGRQHKALIRGIQSVPDLDVRLKVVSAGYGLIDADTPIAPYEATFNGMSLSEIESRGEALGLPQSLKSTIEQTDCDLTLILLGKSYMKACQIESPIFARCPTVFIGINTPEDSLRGTNLYQVPLDNEDAKTFGAGQVWLKGAVASQALQTMAS